MPQQHPRAAAAGLRACQACRSRGQCGSGGCRVPLGLGWATLGRCRGRRRHWRHQLPRLARCSQLPPRPLCICCVPTSALQHTPKPQLGSLFYRQYPFAKRTCMQTIHGTCAAQPHNTTLCQQERKAVTRAAPAAARRPCAAWPARRPRRPGRPSPATRAARSRWRRGRGTPPPPGARSTAPLCRSAPARAARCAAATAAAAAASCPARGPRRRRAGPLPGWGTRGRSRRRPAIKTMVHASAAIIILHQRRLPWHAEGSQQKEGLQSSSPSLGRP